MSPVRLVVLAWGNESRGDDALGPAFLARARSQPDPPGVTTTFVGDFQLQPEHAIDLDGADLALFVDASLAAPAPFSFTEVQPASSTMFSTHGLAPAAVLDAYRQAYRRAPPPAYLLAPRAESFVLGTPLGAAARRHLDDALAHFALLRRLPWVAAWHAVAGAQPNALPTPQEDPSCALLPR